MSSCHLIVLAAVGLFVAAQTSGQPVSDGEKDEAACLRELNLALEVFLVPPRVQELIDHARALNPSLNDKSVTQLLEDKRAELNLYKAGFIKVEEADEWVESCADYVGSVMNVMREESCGQHLIELSEKDKAQFDKELEKNPGVDKVYGFARACLRLI